VWQLSNRLGSAKCAADLVLPSAAAARSADHTVTIECKAWPHAPLHSLLLLLHYSSLSLSSDTVHLEPIENGCLIDGFTLVHTYIRVFLHGRFSSWGLNVLVVCTVLLQFKTVLPLCLIYP